MPNIQSVSDFRNHATTVVKELQDSHETVILTHQGKPSAVLVSYEQWSEEKKAREMLQLLNLRKTDVDSGNLIDSDDVMDEIGSMIENHGK